jgi:hypothetical protein
MPLRITEAFQSLAISFTAGNEGYLILPHTNSLEEEMNALAEDREVTRIQRLHFDAWFSLSTIPFSVAAVLVATSTTPSTGVINSTANTWQNLLDTCCANEYAYTILAQTAKMQTFAFDGVSTVLYSTHLQGTYTPPKGVKGLFESDEHLDEPELRTFLCYLVQRVDLTLGVTLKYNSLIDLQFVTFERTLRLAEL